MIAPKFDFIVSGGGTAGMAAAIHGAKAGLRVLVFDSAGIDFDKPCGEGFMPLALQRLEMLGVVIPESHKLRGIQYVMPHLDHRTIDAHFSQNRAGQGIRRKVLRRAMWERAQALGVEIRTEAVRRIQEVTDGVLVNGERGRYCIVAEGLHSQTVRRLDLLRPRSAKNRFGIRQHFHVVPWSDFVEVWWGEFFEIYITPVAKDTVNVALLSERPLSLRDALAGFPALKAKLGESPAIDPVAGAGPLLHRIRRRRVGRILIVGDAAGFVDAMTGEGNTLALGAGMAASESIVSKRLWLYSVLWWQIVWRYWFLTRISAGIAVRPFYRRLTLKLMGRAPWLLKLGLRFLAGN